MTGLEHEIHINPHYHLRLFFAIAAMVAVILYWAVGPIGTNTSQAVVVSNESHCATDAPGCEMLWLQTNLTNIEHPILILNPETR